MAAADIDLEPALVHGRARGPLTDTTRERSVHADPPTSPSQVLCAPISRMLVIAAAFVALAIVAAVDRGSLLSHLDEPVGRFVIDHRTAWLDRTFRSISFLGSTYVVLAGGALLAAVAYRRCRAVAALVVVATLSRPLVEFTLKESIDRARPDIDQMFTATGPSFPSGHPMAAATLWLMVPVVLALYVRSQRAWWVSVASAVAMVGLIGASRVYLGVHWTSDVVAGILVASLLLVALDVAYLKLHRRRHCAGRKDADGSGPEPPLPAAPAAGTGSSAP